MTCIPFHLAKKLSLFPYRNSVKYSRLNLDRLQYFIDSGRINPNEPITMRVLRMSGAVSGKIIDGVKLLGIVRIEIILLFCYLKDFLNLFKDLFMKRDIRE